MKVAAAKRTLERAAAKFGGHVEDDSAGSAVNLQVCAPEGKVWSESYSEHLVVATYKGPQAWLDDAVQDALARIAYGVEEAS